MKQLQDQEAKNRLVLDAMKTATDEIKKFEKIKEEYDKIKEKLEKYKEQI